jgi:hypothetical protein
MKKTLTLIFIIIAFVSCKNFFSNKNDAIPIDVHEVIAKQSINTGSYTYVLASENSADIWIAIPLTDIKVGETYYYQGGMIMTNFKSKELNRTFDKIMFLEGLSDDKDNLITEPVSEKKDFKKGERHININTSNLKKIDVNIKTANSVVTISELYIRPNQFSEKKVKVSGIVTKFSADIMNKNWVHLQDGTEYEDDFDLTITTSAIVEQGDTVTFEGKIAINKDFGYGYFYKVIMEDATIVKK